MKTIEKILRIAGFTAISLFFLCISPAYASCSSPAGNEADVIYNSSSHTYQFCNGSNWIAYGAAASEGMVLISTQTASSSASLQFTPLPTVYNTLFLNCAGLMQSATADLYFRVGEGTPTTWQVGAHYTVLNYNAGTYTANGGFFNATNATDITAASGFPNPTTFPTAVKMYIDNVNSASIYKSVTYQQSSSVNGESQFANKGEAYWNNDKNPITGIEIVPASGTISSGTCSLYGLN